MNDETACFVSFLTGVVVGGMLMFALTYGATNEAWEKELALTGHARYVISETGSSEFIMIDVINRNDIPSQADIEGLE